MSDTETVIELSKLSICKLPSIISDDGVRDAESAYYIFPNKALNLPSSDLRKRFCFNPLREIVYCH